MRCSECGGKVRADGGTGILGNDLCGSCRTKQMGMAVGMISGGGVGAVVTGPGILRWVSEALNPRKKAARVAREAEQKDAPAS